MAKKRTKKTTTEETEKILYQTPEDEPVIRRVLTDDGNIEVFTGTLFGSADEEDNDILYGAAADATYTTLPSGAKIATVATLVEKALPLCPGINSKYFSDGFSKSVIISPNPNLAVQYKEVRRNLLSIVLSNGTNTERIEFNGENDQFPEMTCDDGYVQSGNNVRYRNNQVVAEASVKALVPRRFLTVQTEGIDFLCEPTAYDETCVLRYNAMTSQGQIIRLELKNGTSGSTVIKVRDNDADKAMYKEYTLPEDYEHYPEESNGLMNFRWYCSDISPDYDGEFSRHRSSTEIITVDVSNLGHNSYFYITALKIPYAKIILHSDGNVVVRDLCEYDPTTPVAKNEGDYIALISPQTTGHINTLRSNPKYYRLSVTLINDTKYERPELSILGAEGSETYSSYMNSQDEYWAAESTVIIKPEENADYIDYQGWLNYTVDISENPNYVIHLAFRAKQKFKATNLKLFINYKDPELFQIATWTVKNVGLGEDTRRYFSTLNTDAVAQRISDDLYFAQYQTRETDFDRENNFLIYVTNNGFNDAGEYTNVYVSASASSSAADSVEVPPSGESAELKFSKPLYRNISIYVRPVLAVRMRFETEDPSIMSHYSVELKAATGWVTVDVPSERPWSSEEGGSIRIRIKNLDGYHLNYANIRVRYGEYNHLNDKQDVTTLAGGVFDDSIMMQSDIEVCYIDIMFFQVFDHAVTLHYPIAGWPTTGTPTTFRLKDNKIYVNGTGIPATTMTDNNGVVSYAFNNEATAQGGSLQLAIDGWQPNYKITDSVSSSLLVCNNDYSPKTSFLSGTISYSGLSYEATIQEFPSMSVNVNYVCTYGSKLRIIAYHQPQGNTPWPTSTSWPDSLPHDDDVIPNTPNASTSFTFGPTFNSSSVKPVPMLRFMQEARHWDSATNTWKWESVNIFNKLNIKLNVVRVSDGSSVTGGYVSIGCDNVILDKTVATNHMHYWDFTPGALTNASLKSYFDAANIGQYSFTLESKIESEYDYQDFKITEVKFATLGSATINDSYTDANGIAAIPDSKRLPCENYGTSNNIIIRFSTPFALGTGRTATLSLVDNNGNELENWWVSMSSATLVSSMLYEFNVKTLTDLWETPINDDNEDTYFDSTVQYRIKITLHDSTYDTNKDRIATFYMQPLIYFEFSANTFSIDNSGLSDVDLVYHIRTSNSSRLPDSATYGDPVFDAAVPNSGDCQVSNLSGLTITVSGPDSSTSNHIRYHVVADNTVNDARTFTASLKVGTTTIKSDTSTLEKNMTVAGIHFLADITNMTSEGGYHGAMTFSHAFVPPVRHSMDSKWGILIYVKLKNTTTMIPQINGFTIASPYNADFETTTVIQNGTIDTDAGPEGIHTNMPYNMILKANIKSGTKLVDVNNELCFSGSSSHPELARYWTNKEIPFNLTVGGTDGFTTPINIPLGPVIEQITMNDGDLDNTNRLVNTSETMKPHTGESHLVRIRAREWIHNGTTPGEDSGYYGTHNGRTYYAKFEYNGTEIPNTSGTSVPQVRQNTNFNITAPTIWTDMTGHTYDGGDGTGDWGAWKINITNDTGLSSGIMTMSMNITGGSDMKTWYPPQTMLMSITDIVTISSIQFNDGQSMVSMSNINAIPLSPVTCNESIKIEGSIPTSQVISNITINTPVGMDIAFTASHSTPGSTSFWIKIKTDDNIFDMNDGSANFYTGQQFACSVDFSYVIVEDGTSTTKTYNMPFTCVLGPVVRLNATSSNLKPAYEETTSVTINAKEYYLNGSNVQLQEGINCGGGINASTTNPNTGTVYALAWNYSGGTIGVAGSTADVIISSVSPSGGYTLKSNKSPEAPEGTITGTINIDTIQAYHWYAPAVSTVSVSQFQIVGARYWNGFDGSSDIFVDVGTNLNNIVIPGSMSREDVAARFTIFINCPTATAEGVEWELIVDNEGVAGNATWDINTDDSGNYNGHPYNCVAEFDWEFEPMVVNEEYPNSLWRGKAIPFSITQKISGVVQASISFTATMGIFGRIEINSPSATQVGLPGNEFEFIGRKFTVEYVNGSAQEIPSVLDESDIKIVLPGGLTTSDIDYSYDTNTGKFFIYVYREVSSTYIRLAARLNNETYVEDWSYRTINFSSDWYLNFFTANTSESGLSFFLAPTYSGVYGPNSNAPSSTTYDGDVGTVNIVQDFGSSYCSKSNALYGTTVTFYYMTFKVVVDSYNNIRLKRVKQNSGSISSLPYSGMATRGGSPETIPNDYVYIIGESDCPPQQPPYAYAEQRCGLVCTTATEISYSGHTVWNFRTMYGGGSGPARTSINWGFEKPYSNLDSQPFWSSGFSPWNT